MDGKKQLLLGLFVLSTLSILAWYTLFLTDFRFFGESTRLVVHFINANGLRKGDPLLVAGIRAGRVGALTFDPSAPQDRRITATLVLDLPVVLHTDFAIRIEDATLLGGKRIDIDPGSPDAPLLAADTVLFGIVHLSPLDTFSDVIGDNREEVTRMLENVDLLTTNLVEGRGLLGRILSDEELGVELEGGLRDFSSTMQNASAISDDLREGRGTIGRLLSDEELYAEAKQIADSLQRILDDTSTFTGNLREGRGALSRLVEDQQVGDDVAAAIATVREVVDRINAGEGTLGRLVVDPSLAENLSGVARKLNEGEGTIGRLMTDEEVYVRLAQIADDLSAASSAVRNSEGTLGKLVMDEELYKELRRAVGTVNRTLEEFREAAPVSTFTSVLFGGF